MQRVLRRNILSRNQVLRRKRKQLEHDAKVENQQILTAQVRLSRYMLDDIKAERKARREDWLLGPLAPNREVGVVKGSFGALEADRQNLPDVRVSKRVKYCNFVSGDRVCVVDGREKGKIGEVVDVDRATETVTVQGLNVQTIRVPHFLRELDRSRPRVTNLPLPIPFSSVRLVVPLPQDPNDPSSPKKEAVVRAMYGGPPFREHPYGVNLPAHTRYISGLDQEIPWPEKEADEITEEEIDTTRYQVEERTYLSELDSPPMPLDVVDEIVNKRSRMKTRHDPQFIEKMVMEDVKGAWEQRRKLSTPKEEMWERKEKERKEELNRLEVSEETMRLIRETQALSLGGETSKRLPEAKHQQPQLES